MKTFAKLIDNMRNKELFQLNFFIKSMKFDDFDVIIVRMILNIKKNHKNHFLEKSPKIIDNLLPLYPNK